MTQFWQCNNTVSSGGFAGDSANSESIENHQLFIEYFTSLLDISEKKNKLNSFFPKELLSDSITIRRINEHSMKRAYGIRKVEQQKKQVNEENDSLENKGMRDDFDLFADDESEIDFEYINPVLDDEYDELEDNIKDQDVI
ncbi:hypothetical protein FG386_002443 [Cryptosporidium ryanae]|uniref:uncharacterized protein n=1 Tax=Cryptosporidium ryanae TaxID=515981 RepID=UPI00351A3BA7|nr:hypothetical protein FG386_002443 [Cryptosporidium ryanae]